MNTNFMTMWLLLKESSYITNYKFTNNSNFNIKKRLGIECFIKYFKRIIYYLICRLSTMNIK